MSSLEQPIESQMTPENNFNPLSDAERKEYNELSFDTHSDPVKMARLKELQGRLDMQANINKGEMGQDRQARIRKAEENLSAGPFSEEERKRYVELQMSGKPEDRPELEKLQDKLIGEKEE